MSHRTLFFLPSLLWAFSGALLINLSGPTLSLGQDADLAAQIRQLRAKVVRLEASLPKSGPGQPAGMGGMMDDDMMGGPSMMDDGMGAMPAAAPAAPMMDDDMDLMGMMGQGSMTGMGTKGPQMKRASALPGFPGVSHLYHIGASGFFLDHPKHVSLTKEQQTKLNRLKQKTLLGKSKVQRQIDEAEQSLWELTSADEPDVEQIETKISEIERLRSEQRLAFIRSVGEAAQVLTSQQREALLGQAKPDAGHAPAAK